MSTGLWQYHTPPELGARVIVETMDGHKTFARRVFRVQFGESAMHVHYVDDNSKPLRTGVLRWLDPVSLDAIQ